MSVRLAGVLLILSALTLSGCGGGGGSSSAVNDPPPATGSGSNPPPPASPPPSPPPTSGFDTSRNYIVYLSNDDIFDTAVARQDLYVYQPATGTRHKLNPDLAPGSKVFAFAISPTRSKVAFTSDHETAGIIEIYSVNPDGTDLVKLNAALSSGGNVSPFGFHWSPDGTRVAYHGDVTGEGRNNVYSSSATGDMATLSQTAIGNAVTGSIEWSPDSTRLVFRQSGGSNSLFVVGADGSGLASLSNSSYLSGAIFDNNVQWAPDGSRVLYFADEDANDVFELYTVMPDGSGHTRINGELVPDGDVFGSSVLWALDSEKVIYAANQDTLEVIDIYSVNADGSGAIKLNDPISPPTGATPAQEGVIPWTAQMSPDGSTVTYLVTPTQRELYAANLDGSRNAKLNGPLASSLNDVDDTSVLWSPDGTRLAFSANETQNAIHDLFSVTLDSLDKDTLTAPSAVARAVLSPSINWAPDSASLVYLSNQTSSTFDLYHVQADGSNLTRLNSDLADGMEINSGQVLWAPDGGRILYLLDDAVGTKLIASTSADGTSSANLNPDLAQDAYIVTDEVQWSPDSEWIVYRADQDTDDVYELYVASADGAVNRKVNLTLVSGQRIEGSFVWSP